MTGGQHVDRVFLLSSERSGSNLLRTILARSSRLDGPPAPQLFKALFPYRDRLPIARNRRSRQRILRLARSLLYVHPMPWPEEIDLRDLRAFETNADWTVIDLIDTLYLLHARSRGKSGYVVKENNVFHWAREIGRRFPEARFVYLHRDPRDVFLSFRNVPGGPKTPTTFSRQWVSEQRECLAAVDQLGGDRAIRVRYEDLVTAPARTVALLCDHLGIGFDPAMLDPEPSTGQPAGVYWQNLSKPILADNIGKFASALRPGTIACVESVCAGVMRELGYTPTAPKRTPPSTVRVAMNTVLDKMLMVLAYRRKLGNQGEYGIRIRRARIYAEIRTLAGEHGDLVRTFLSRNRA